MVTQWFQTIVIPPILWGKWLNCRRFFDLVVETPIKPINNFLRSPCFFFVCVCVSRLCSKMLSCIGGGYGWIEPELWSKGVVTSWGSCVSRDIRAVWAINWLCRVPIGDEILPSYVGIYFHNPWSGSLWNKRVREFFRFLFVSRMPVPRKEENK